MYRKCPVTYQSQGMLGWWVCPGSPECLKAHFDFCIHNRDLTVACCEENIKLETGSNRTSTFYVGTYSEKGPYVPNANGQGVVSCILDLDSGKIRRIDICRDAENSTYLAKSPDGKFIFAAVDKFSSIGSIRALSVNSNGNLSLLSSQKSHGKSTCHISCDQKGNMIFATSYMDGKLTVHKFEGKKVFPASQIISYEGSGPNKERQETAHAHQAQVSPDNQWLYVCDLGSDKIWVHDISDILSGSYSTKSIDIPAGYGPRHLIWNAELPLAYIFCELNSHILVTEWDDDTGKLSIVENKNVLPKEYKGKAAGAAIRLHPGNKALFTSDRGHNSIVVCKVDENNGKLEYEDWFSVRGKTPRDFNIDPTGEWLLAANQDSDAIVPFRLDPVSGLPTGEEGPAFECGTPACILFKN